MSRFRSAPAIRKHIITTISGRAGDSIRRRLISLLVVTVAVSRAIAAETTPASVPIHLGTGPHLLLDSGLVAVSEGVTRTTQRPVRGLKEPVINGKDDGNFQPYFTILRDDKSGRFRIWYNVPTGAPSAGRSKLGYMESEDGIHWIQPHRVLGGTGGIQYCASVIDDGPGAADPAQRYKLGFHMDRGLKIAASPDGLAWTPMNGGKVLIPQTHDINSIWRDDIRKQYVATLSFFEEGPAYPGKRRQTKQATSTDLIHWSEPWYVLRTDEKDQGRTEFYAMDGFIQRGGLTIGMVKVLRDDVPADLPPTPKGAYGTGYTTLAWTRDGTHWTREREPFFERDPDKNAWDHSHAWIDEQLPVGDEVYLYYAGYAHGHKVNAARERQIGLLRIKRDRYVAYEAGDKRGTFRTPAVTLDASDGLTINADASPGGEVRVQVLDEAQKPIKGYAFADMKPVTKDALATPVQWQEPLSRLKGRTVCLEFSVRNAKVYAFELK